MNRVWLTMCAVGVAVACGGAATAPTPGSTTLPAALAPITTPPLPTGITVTVRGMLQSVATYIVLTYAELQESRPRNPQLDAQYTAKLTMLAAPGLISQIFNGRQWIEGSASTVRGAVPIGAVFPDHAMWNEATDTVRLAEMYLPVLVEFFDEAFPTGELEIWYGFKMGNSGGGGAVYTEDRTTYQARSIPSMLKFDAIIAHEIGHTYMGNEALTQFLELFALNVSHGRGVDPLAWTETRGWTPTQATSFGVTYVMDIYHRIGLEAIRRAYRAVRVIRPAYGQPLSEAALAAFLAEVPPADRAFVEAKLRAIIA